VLGPRITRALNMIILLFKKIFVVDLSYLYYIFFVTTFIITRLCSPEVNVKSIILLPFLK